MVENNRILVVDDEISIQKIFQRILSPPLKTDVLSQGAVLFGETHEQPDEAIRKRFVLTLVDCGLDGIKAVEAAMIKKQPFALAFIDLGLEGIDGVETARQIWEADPNIKIVFATGSIYFDPENIYRATGRNDFFHLKKPFSIKEVKEIAQALTQQWADEQKRRENQNV
ncbi:MAG: response regulator [Pseudomonadota bacterium]